jgi:hypothetical protein
VIFAWAGLAVLRRAWINLDLVWSFALIATGAIFLVLAGIDLASRHAHQHHAGSAAPDRYVAAGA